MNASKPLESLEIELQERLAKVHHTEDEIREVLDFLKPFCATAKIYITELFVRGKIHKKAKPFHDIIEACRKQNELVWRSSSPNRYGDPDDVSVDEAGVCRGMKNYTAMATLYPEINLPLGKGIH